jgi:hypothetical protein
MLGLVVWQRDDIARRVSIRCIEPRAHAAIMLAREPEHDPRSENVEA